MADPLNTKNVTKFDGANFTLWKFQMNAIFTAHGLKEIVDGTKAEPAAADPTRSEWIKDNAIAVFLLERLLKEEVRVTTSDDMANALATMNIYSKKKFTQSSKNSKLLKKAEKRECYYCYKTGHLIKECRARKKANEKQNRGCGNSCDNNIEALVVQNISSS